MNQKKEAIIQVLKKLKPYRNLAEGILALVESPYIDEKSIDGIIKFIANSIKRIKKHIKEKQQGKWIQKIKKLEEKIYKEEMQSIQEAEEILEDILKNI